jgi:N-acetylglucosaminyl-diphospho-decaprenol L-rhamnosyltransferase
VAPLTVVVLTHNRLDPLLTTLERLRALPEQPHVVVVDNASDDGTPQVVRERFPDVTLIERDVNDGAAGRNEGVRAAATELVAFCDDDSWYEPGALTRAAELFAAHPRLGLIAARILVGPERKLDPTCAEMAGSALGVDPATGLSRVLGFVACGAVVRGDAFLAAGGFHSDYAIGGEEHLVALDMAAAGWELIYADDVVAHHHPPQRGPKAGRRRRAMRNDLWSAWLRRPLPGAIERTARLAWGGRRDREARAGVVDALRGAPRIMRDRRPVPPRVERAVRRLER